jgi:hypothetical protein
MKWQRYYAEGFGLWDRLVKDGPIGLLQSWELAKAVAAALNRMNEEKARGQRGVTPSGNGGSNGRRSDRR